MAGINRVRVWCEDRAHEAFARRLLQRKGVDLKKCNFRPAPKGRGSAASWILKQCADIGALIRATRAQRDLGFIIIVDGDSQGFKARLQAVRDELERAQAGIDSSRLAILVPTWSVETWFLALAGERVAEVQSYKSRIEPSRIGPLSIAAAEAWDNACVQDLPALLDARAQLTTLLG